MSITITPQSVLTFSAVVAAIIALVGNLRKTVLWVEKQNQQDKDIKGIKAEQAILCRGILACLKGLHEQGCNDSVTEAINEMEQHLNQEAHK